MSASGVDLLSKVHQNLGLFLVFKIPISNISVYFDSLKHDFLSEKRYST